MHMPFCWFCHEAVQFMKKFDITPRLRLATGRSKAMGLVLFDFCKVLL